jgi:hypothetical protein
MARSAARRFGEFLLIIATWAAVVAALIEQGVAWNLKRNARPGYRL